MVHDLSFARGVLQLSLQRRGTRPCVYDLTLQAVSVPISQGLD